MDPTAFLAVAARLAQDPGGIEAQAAAFRTAVSRAYYAAYHTVHLFLRSFDCSIERGGKGHADVHVWLTAASVQDLRYASSLLGDLQHLRLAADYGLEDPRGETSGAAAQAIELAKETIAIVDETAANAQLCAAITRHLQPEIRRRRP